MPPTPKLSAAEIRRQFIDFFVSRHAHTFVSANPVVPHDDPTLLFTNAGMNQFKPIFLGQAAPGSDLGRLKRAANSQKCIRAGGKHNDLDDVGKDLYHHTFFEMLGNWSFGDYFKAEAIDWAWELLTKVWGIDPNRLYATYFEGSKAEGLEVDREAYDLWLKYLPAQRVLPGNMKDNFWEMGDTGPCGPCSEIHYDGRSDEERAREPGYNLVNRGHADVIEIWNLVFIQFNRTAPGAAGLKPLPAKHVDTGMGFERITRVVQGKASNYDTDVFAPYFAKIQQITKAPPYAGSLTDPRDVAYRVLADHVRTLTFAITDGAEPSNEGRGYVLRRILRRAVKYGHQNLGALGPFLCDLVPTVVETMGEFFPELRKDPAHVAAIIRDEEEAFGRTLERGIEQFEVAMLEAIRQASPSVKASGGDATHNLSAEQEKYGTALGRTRTLIVEINGKSETLQASDLTAARIKMLCPNGAAIAADHAFKLHDTYGFPIDLTQIMAEERGMTVDVEGFHKLMDEARQRARTGGAGAEQEHPAKSLPGDAVARLRHMSVQPTDDSLKFEVKQVRATVRAIWNGADFDESLQASSTRITDRFGIILDRTNFYAEMGGQVGDTGRLDVSRESRASVRDKGGGGEFRVEEARAFGGYVLHIGRIAKGEIRVGDDVVCELEKPRRAAVMANHTATHLLNFALRETLGDRVEQKGSLVAPDRLRFDFSHGHAVAPAEMQQIERIVGEQVALDLPVCAEAAPQKAAKRINGLRAVFGEAYPDPVRVVSIGAPVSALLENPESPDWRKLSIEFCGGTHVESTAQIGAFAVVEESAVAKGVRRVVAITGAPAEQANTAAETLKARIHVAARLGDDALETEAAALAHDIEHGVLPLTARRELHASLEALHERIKESRKKAAAAGRGAAVDAARHIAESNSGPVIVAQLPGDDAGADRQAMLSALDAVRAKHAASAVMLLAADREGGKVSIVAGVPAALIAKGLKAGDWVRVAAEACGGKGGGRPDSAQGGGTQLDKLPAAAAAARDFATAKAM